MKNEANWHWPEELDALKADPYHHKLLFENNEVRVLDTLVPPGDKTNVHTHQWPASLYILSWSDFIRYDVEGNVLVDSRNFSSSPLPSSAAWSEPLTPHFLKNIGDDNLHIISVEIKQR